MKTDRVDSRQIPVPTSEQKPSGCPDHGAASTQDCAGPLNNTVCEEFCPKTQIKRQRAILAGVPQEITH